VNLLENAIAISSSTCRSCTSAPAQAGALRLAALDDRHLHFDLLAIRQPGVFREFDGPTAIGTGDGLARLAWVSAAQICSR
jgi:hypothetical protein